MTNKFCMALLFKIFALPHPIEVQGSRLAAGRLDQWVQAQVVRLKLNVLTVIIKLKLGEER